MNWTDEHIIEYLEGGLDADQRKAFMAANKEAAEARKGLKDITDKKERAAKMKEISKNLDTKLGDILNEDQLAKLKEARAEMAKARKAKAGEAKGKGKGKKKE